MFISFEGIEGCGKTTQLACLAAELQSCGYRVTRTREPGGCPIADQVREILLDAANTALLPTAELLLYAAARAQHVAEVIRPALERGDIVLCDRFCDATIAYQGYGRGLDRQLIEQLNHLAAGTTRPAMTVLLDCPVETGLGRALARIANGSGPAEARFEAEAMEFHQRVRDGYLRLADSEPGRFVIVNADRPPALIATDIARSIRERLAQP